MDCSSSADFPALLEPFHRSLHLEEARLVISSLPLTPSAQLWFLDHGVAGATAFQFPRCRAGRLLIASGSALFVLALPISLDREFICLAWRHAQCWMSQGLVFFVSPVLHPFSQSWERPHCLATGISRSGHLSRNARCLRIAEQMIEDGGVQGAEESFLRRPKPWFRCRALLFAHPIERQQLFKVNALKFGAAIDHQSGWQAPISFHTQAQRHHTRAVRRWIKGQIERRNSARRGKNEQG